jgi:hypothetical protein
MRRKFANFAVVMAQLVPEMRRMREEMEMIVYDQLWPPLCHC